jgi:hypothetical protein
MASDFKEDCRLNMRTAELELLDSSPMPMNDQERVALAQLRSFEQSEAIDDVVRQATKQSRPAHRTAFFRGFCHLINTADAHTVIMLVKLLMLLVFFVAMAILAIVFLQFFQAALCAIGALLICWLLCHMAKHAVRNDGKETGSNW